LRKLFYWHGLSPFLFFIFLYKNYKFYLPEKVKTKPDLAPADSDLFYNLLDKAILISSNKIFLTGQKLIDKV